MSFDFNKYNYDCWIHWNITSVCNFNCNYCFGHIGPEHKIDPIKINDLVQTLDSTNKTFRISFTGGEPLLVPNIIEASETITKNHFISLNTNMASNRIEEFANIIDPQRVVRVHASFHFEELTNKKMLSTFIDRVILLDEKSFPVHVEAVAYPGIKEKVQDVKNMLLNNGITLKYGPYFGKIEDKTYPEDYSLEELEIFGFSDEDKYTFDQKGNLCNAGFNAFIAYRNGDLYPCFQVNENSGNIYEKIIFSESIRECSHLKCGCPLNLYDEKLHRESMVQTNRIKSE